VDYYEGFFNELHASAPERLEIIAQSHSGHVLDRNIWSGLPLTAPSGLQDQVDVKVALVDKISSAYGGGTKTVLIGHSMGSWVATKVKDDNCLLLTGT
jgi:alpha-beta hydrolase superfamily lysophospholipase